MQAHDNGNLPAHPQEWNAHIEGAPAGLTKREYFAGLALQGLCAASNEYARPEHMAQDAIMFADALLDELGKGAK